MDKEKAFEIVNSLGVTCVNYKGKSVWIEDIYEDTNEAKVKDLSTEKNFLVNISELEES